MESFESEPNVLVLAATSEDAAGIRDVQRDAWIATYPNEEYGITREDIESKDWANEERIERWRKNIEGGPDKKVWVAKVGERVVGFCVAKKNGEKNQIQAIYIHPDYQGKGVGSKLMNGALAWVEPSKETFVEVAKYNANAISFYERFGFAGSEDIVISEGASDLPSGKVIPEIRMIREAELSS